MMTKSHNNSQSTTEPNTDAQSAGSRSKYGFFLKAFLHLSYTCLIVWVAFLYFQKSLFSDLEQTLSTRSKNYLDQKLAGSQQGSNTDIQQLSEDISKIQLELKEVKNASKNSDSSTSSDVFALKQEIKKLHEKLDQQLKRPSENSAKIQLIRIILEGGHVTDELTGKLSPEVRATLSKTRDFPENQEIIRQWKPLRSSFAFHQKQSNFPQQEGGWSSLRSLIRDSMKIQRINDSLETSEEVFIASVEQHITLGEWNSLEKLLLLNQERVLPSKAVSLHAFIQLVAKKSLGEKLLSMVYQKND